MKAFIDADILIWHLRGERKASRFLRGLLDDPSVELWTGAMQRAEIIFFMRPAEEELTMLLLSQLKTATVDQSVIDEAGRLYRKWNPSHGVDPNDSILAATVLLNGGVLYTQNTKHYPMKEVAVQKAW
jgi:predicted nucleic acid-binding protein